MQLHIKIPIRTFTSNLGAIFQSWYLQNTKKLSEFKTILFTNISHCLKLFYITVFFFSMCATSGSDSTSTFWDTCLPHKVETPVIFGIPIGSWSAPGETCLSPDGGFKHFWWIQQVQNQGTKSNSTHVQIVVQDWSIILHHTFTTSPEKPGWTVEWIDPPPCHVHPFHKDLGALTNPSYWPLLTFWIFSEGIVSFLWTGFSVVPVHTTGPKLYFWQKKEHLWAGIKTIQK